MVSTNNSRLLAGVLAAALLLPATTALGNDWSKPKSRTKGTAIGMVAGAIVAGPPGAAIGAAVGNGVQAVRQQSTARHHRHHRHY